MFCNHCGVENPDYAHVCRNCGRPFQKKSREMAAEVIAPPVVPLASTLIHDAQSSVGNVPVVQGTPQVSGVPMVQGTPSTLDGPQAARGSLPQQPVHAPQSSPTHQSPVYQQPGHTLNPPRSLPSHTHPAQSQQPFGSGHSQTVTQQAVSTGARAAGHVSRRVFLSLLGGAAVVIGGGALLYMNHLAPQRTVSTFIDALNNNDFQTAYDQLSTNFQHQIGGVQQFENMYPNLGSATYTLNITQEDSSTATVVWTQTDSACYGAQDTLHMVYENGAWKIDSISFDVPCSQ